MKCAEIDIFDDVLMFGKKNCSFSKFILMKKCSFSKIILMKNCSF
jgi:hypothetical protein